MKTNTIQEDILFFLYRKNYFNKRHTPVINVCNKLSRIPCKEIKKELKNLNKLYLVGIKPTAHGKDVFLNIGMIDEIEKIISKKLDELEAL